jgi:hypothetical protein
MSCNSKIGCSASPTGCPDQYGCVAGVCPDLLLKRNDTKPPFKVKVEDCDGPLDLKDLVLEASMWARAKLKTAISTTDEYFALADNIGFNQIMVDDIIVMDRPRLPEKMLVTGFDETNKLVRVQRAYHGTTAQAWKKGSPLRIFKFIGSTAETEMVYEDILRLDGTTEKHVHTESFFIYEWGENDTCLPGCYYLEFKLIKMLDDDDSVESLSVTPSFTNPSFTPTDFGCGLGTGVEWIRRFPTSEGFLIKISDSPTQEN